MDDRSPRVPAQLFGHGDQRLGVSGGEGATGLDSLRPGALTRLNGLAGMSLNCTASVNACRQTFRQLSTVYGEVLVEQLRLPLRQDFGATSTTAVGSDGAGQVARGASLPPWGATGGATLQLRLQTSAHLSGQNPWSEAGESDFGASERATRILIVELGGIRLGPPS